MISIIMQCKNDRYRENFLQRFTFCISKHIDNIKTLGLENDVQIVLTDWGSEEKLIDVLDVDFSLIKYIYVNPDTAKKYNGDTEYSYVHPLNVSARNSDGDYILWGDSDGFLPLESFRKIYNITKDITMINNFYWGSRFYIKINDYNGLKTIEEIDQLIENKIYHKYDIIDCENFCGRGGILLLTKKMYFETTGMWEKLIYWGWQDTEFHHRLLNKYTFGGDLINFGSQIYHLEHLYSGIIKVNDYIDSPIFDANGENWGLGNEKLEIIYKK